MTDTEQENSQPEPPSGSRSWRLLLAIVSLAVLIYIGWPYRGELHKLLKADPWFLLAIIANSLVNRVLITEVFVQTLRAVGVTMSRIEGFMLMVLRGYSGLFVPRSGIGTTGLYLNKRHGLRYAHYTALLLPIGLVQCAAMGLMGLAALAILWFRNATPVPPSIALIFTLGAIFAAAALMVRVKVSEDWPGRLAHFVRGLNSSWHELSRNRSLLLRLVALQTVAVFARATRLYFCFCALGYETSFWGVLVASILADFAFFFNITPAGLGFREAAIVFGAQVTGVTGEEALAAAIFDRLIMTGTLVLLAQVSLLKMPGLQKENAAE